MVSAAELAQRALDLAGIEDDSMTWSGADYSGVLTELTKGDDPSIGGFSRGYTASFFVRTALFESTRPNVDDTVTVGSKSLKVSRVHEYPDDIAIELELVAPDGNNA